jgi:hypothetical protein
MPGIAQEGKAVAQVAADHLTGKDENGYKEGDGKAFF